MRRKFLFTITAILILLGMWIMWRHDQRTYLGDAYKFQYWESDSGLTIWMPETSSAKAHTIHMDHWQHDLTTGAYYCQRVTGGRKAVYLPCTPEDEKKQAAVLQ